MRKVRVYGCLSRMYGCASVFHAALMRGVGVSVCWCKVPASQQTPIISGSVQNHLATILVFRPGPIQYELV
jgi:hypothetical protein